MRLFAITNRVLSARHQVPMRQFTPAVTEALRSQTRPGNVRELRNLIQRQLRLNSSEVVALDELPHSVPPAPGSPTSLAEAERDAILRALDHEHGNLAGAARRLGVSRSTIYRKICRYGVDATKLK